MERPLFKSKTRPAATIPFAGNLLQRKCSCKETKTEGVCESCGGTRENQQHADIAPPIVHEVLQSGGNSLDANTRSEMEPHFGHDFGKVRVHTGAKAAESARTVNALAYTVGQNIIFNDGQYHPEHGEGKQLLAHELMHVVQQSGASNSGSELRLGASGDFLEKEANQKSVDFAGGVNRHSGKLKSNAGSISLQRQVTGLALIPPVNLSAEDISIAEGESITAENPKLVSLAGSFKQMLEANPREYIKLSTYLSEASKLSSSKAAEERRRLNQRMSNIQTALVKLGVPVESVEIESATVFSNKSGGQITGSLYKSPRVFSQIYPQGPYQAPAAPASPATVDPSLADLLSFKFNAGSVQFAVELPKSVSVKLPIALTAAKTLSFILKAESSGEFSFTIALNGLKHLNVSAKAGLKVNKDSDTTMYAGIEITTTKTVCNAPSPESLKFQITAAGDKLTKAMKELETVKPDERLSKLADIAGAIGEMYDAVDKAKSACKEVPRATINLGVQGPNSPNDSRMDDPDPFKRPGTFIGGTVTFPF